MSKPKEHSERAHALLSASGSPRWMNCTPSARLEEGFPESTSSFAQEGTLAHEFGEIFLLKEIGRITPSAYLSACRKLRESVLYTDEMEEQVMKYVDFVMEQYQVARKATPDAILSIEDKIDLTEFIEEGFGSNDAMVIADTTLYVSDLKYGKGVQVSAVENSQLKLYGLGALVKTSLLYDIEKVSLNIIQPRLDHVSTWEISAEDLLAWGENEVKTKAQKAYAGEGEPTSGAWCRWCRAKAKCRAIADKNLELAKMDFRQPQLLTDKELIKVNDQLSTLVDWAKSVAEYMLSEAVKGKKFKGYKVVAGRSNRKWIDEKKAVKTLLENDWDKEDIINSKLKGIGAIEKLLGKMGFTYLMGPHVEKPVGLPTLVDENDSRQEFGISEAKEDFK